jgi:outer membrane protein
MACAVAGAQEIPIEPDRPTNFIGLAVVSMPDYMGSDDNTGTGAPLFRYQFEGSDRYFTLLGMRAKLNLIDSKIWRAGPVLNRNPGRDSDDIDDEVVKNMETIDAAVEAGVFGEYWFMGGANSRDRANIGLSVLTDTDSGDDSDGMHVRLSGTMLRQVLPKADIVLGAALEYADDDYMQTYFGVNADNVGTSGLPFYEAKSGLRDVELTLGGLYYIDKSWMALGVLRFSQLQGDAADSPIVDQRGDDNQWLLGFGAAYMW